MRSPRIAVLLVLAPLVFAQDKKGTTPSGKYVNSEIGLTFAGVYGWESRFALGSGAWTELASYREAAMDATVLLLVRNNSYGTLDAMRSALKKEFAESAEPAAGRPAFKEISYRDVEMKRGLKLKGIEVEGFVVRVTDEGKKREHYVYVRTFFGKNRLFRVACSAKRSRKKRVKDRFEIAMASLVVTGAAEEAITGLPFTSRRGGYRLLVPSGVTAVLPGSRSKSDMLFAVGRTGIAVSIYSYAQEGDLIDHRDVLSDYYGDSLVLGDDDVKVMGTTGFRGVLTRGEKVTLIAGTVKNGRFYRVHTAGPKAKLEDARRVHEAFLKGFRIGR